MILMKIAIVRVRGIRKIRPDVEKTFEYLNLEKPNNCVIIDDTPMNMGMVMMVKDYVTYGPISEDVLFSLVLKKGEKGSVLLKESMDEAAIKKIAKEIFSGKKVSEFANSTFRLRPPSKGYKNTKKTYPMGDLGKRTEMDSLIKRMI